MNVHPVEELSAYLSGELDFPERIGVEEHLSECGDCRRELNRLRNLNEVLSGTKTLDPSSAFLAGILKRLDQPQVIIFSRRKIVSVAAIAAAITFVVISFSHQNEVHPPPGIVHTIIRPQSSALLRPTTPPPVTQLSEQDVELIADLDLLESMDVIQNYDSVENIEYAMVGDSEDIKQ